MLFVVAVVRSDDNHMTPPARERVPPLRDVDVISWQWVLYFVAMGGAVAQLSHTYPGHVGLVGPIPYIRIGITYYITCDRRENSPRTFETDHTGRSHAAAKCDKIVP